MRAKLEIGMVSPELKGDIDRDGEVGLFDLIIMKNQYGGSGCPYLTPPCTVP